MKQFKFHCPNCGQRFAATMEKAGTASKCSTCKQDMMVPMAPSWLKLGFAKEVIPALLSETPAILIRAAHSTEGLNVLKEAWNEFAQDECDPAEYTPPDELEVTSVRDEGALIVTLTFPKAYRESEAYYGVAILTVPAGTKLTNDTLRLSTKRYFLLSLYSGNTNCEEAVGGKIKSHGKGTLPDDREAFVSWARKKCGLSGETPDPTGTSGITVGEIQMAEAFAEARSTLNAALQRFLKGEYETFSVKIPIIEGDKKEHLWLGDLKYYTDGTFAGIIEDRPKLVESIVQGQACEVAYDDVTDWQSFHQGKIHGNYSLRALIPELPSEEAAKYHAVLAELPSQQPVPTAPLESPDDPDPEPEIAEPQAAEPEPAAAITPEPAPAPSGPKLIIPPPAKPDSTTPPENESPAPPELPSQQPIPAAPQEGVVEPTLVASPEPAPAPEPAIAASPEPVPEPATVVTPPEAEVAPEPQPVSEPAPAPSRPKLNIPPPAKPDSTTPPENESAAPPELPSQQPIPAASQEGVVEPTLVASPEPAPAPEPIIAASPEPVPKSNPMVITGPEATPESEPAPASAPSRPKLIIPPPPPKPAD